MNSRGIVISLDALIALLIFFSIIASSIFYFSQVHYDAKNSILLKESAMDALIVLEKSGTLEKAIQSNKVVGIRRFINKLPNSMCFDLSLFHESDLSNAIISFLKPGCKKNFIDSATFNRGFIVRNDFEAEFYIARITAWQRLKE